MSNPFLTDDSTESAPVHQSSNGNATTTTVIAINATPPKPKESYRCLKLIAAVLELICFILACFASSYSLWYLGFAIGTFCLFFSIITSEWAPWDYHYNAAVKLMYTILYFIIFGIYIIKCINSGKHPEDYDSCVLDPKIIRSICDKQVEDLRHDYLVMTIIMGLSSFVSVPEAVINVFLYLKK